MNERKHGIESGWNFIVLVFLVYELVSKGQGSLEVLKQEIIRAESTRQQKK